MDIYISQKRIETEQTTSEKHKHVLELSLGWWIEIELISELLGFVESIGGALFGSAVTVSLLVLFFLISL